MILAENNDKRRGVSLEIPLFFYHYFYYLLNLLNSMSIKMAIERCMVFVI